MSQSTEPLRLAENSFPRLASQENNNNNPEIVVVVVDFQGAQKEQQQQADAKNALIEIGIRPAALAVALVTKYGHVRVQAVVAHAKTRGDDPPAFARRALEHEWTLPKSKEELKDEKERALAQRAAYAAQRRAEAEAKHDAETKADSDRRFAASKAKIAADPGPDPWLTAKLKKHELKGSSS